MFWMKDPVPFSECNSVLKALSVFIIILQTMIHYAWSHFITRLWGLSGLSWFLDSLAELFWCHAWGPGSITLQDIKDWDQLRWHTICNGAALTYCYSKLLDIINAKADVQTWVFDFEFQVWLQLTTDLPVLPALQNINSIITAKQNIYN